MSRLEDLSLELLRLIVRPLYDEQHPSQPLKSLSLVCRRFKTICSGFLFRHLNVALSSKEPTQCAALLKLLLHQEELRASVREVTLALQRLSFHGHNKFLEDLVIQLLPLLPNLQQVRIGGDECRDYGLHYDNIDLRPINVSILRLIDKLPRPIQLYVECYIQTVNFEARLDELSCLAGLRVCILNTIHAGPPKYPESYVGNPSQDVAKLISNNTKLKYLHLSLQGEGDWQMHPMHAETKQNALHVIGPALSDLDSLVLEGDLLFSNTAWITWINHFSKLRSLKIMGITLVQEVTGRFSGPVRMLKMLKLSAFNDTFDRTRTTFRGNTRSLETFLSMLSLNSLSLSGFQSSVVMQALPSIGASLQNLDLHIREN